MNTNEENVLATKRRILHLNRNVANIAYVNVSRSFLDVKPERITESLAPNVVVGLRKGQFRGGVQDDVRRDSDKVALRT